MIRFESKIFQQNVDNTTTMATNITDLDDYLLFHFENISAQIFADKKEFCKIENSKVITKNFAGKYGSFHSRQCQVHFQFALPRRPHGEDPCVHLSQGNLLLVPGRPLPGVSPVSHGSGGLDDLQLVHRAGPRLVASKIYCFSRWKFVLSRLDIK